jgi:HPt (histidine-containing phosphotransfer) domain-containing protein
MATMTKTQVLDENVALRNACALLEQQLASLRAEHAELRTKARTAYGHVRTERDEAVEALHRLKGELLASKLPAAPTFWTNREGQRFQRIVVRSGQSQLVRNVPVAAE